MSKKLRAGELLVLPIAMEIAGGPSAPTLSAAVCAGSSTVTLTLTPPASGPYEQTYIYRRIKGSASAWTYADNHVGAQGVAAAKTISVTQTNRLWEFIAVTVADGEYSLPSAVRTAFVTGADAYRAALAAIEAELEADPTLAAYVDVFNVQEWDEARLPSFTDAGRVIVPVSHA